MKLKKKKKTDLVLNKWCTEFESLFKANSKGIEDVFLSDIEKQLRQLESNPSDTDSNVADLN